jgi:hypothetical protein
MTGVGLDRRAFLGLLLTGLLGTRRPAAGETVTRHESYSARTALLYGLLRFENTGAIDEAIDRAAGRYQVVVAGQGAEMTTRIESEGLLREERWSPTRTVARFVVYGRESRTETRYDYARRAIDFHARAETFLLRRLRVVDDQLPLGDGHVDDVISATLNYAERRWTPDPDGSLRTLIVRRGRRADEGPDDVEKAYRAEVVPFVLRVQPDPQTGKPGALFDLTRFSSWARESEPARITFGPDRRPETITASLILGTSVTIRLGSGGASPTSRAGAGPDLPS